MKNLSFTAFLFSILLLSACGQQPKQESGENEDILILDSIPENDEYDWTPERFKEEQHDEWVVVKNAINIQQKRDGEIDYAAIGKLVDAYIRKKEIVLPSDAGKRIAQIESICRKCFDFEKYVTGNFEMRIAWGTSRLFDEYVLWLYEKEAQIVLSHNPVIDLEKERELMGALNDAMLHVCDSVAYRLAGSGNYVGYENVQYIKLNFDKNTYKSLLGSKIKTGRQLVVPMDVFDKECDLLIANYEPTEEGQAEDAAPLVKRFQEAFHKWYEYRKSASSKLKEGKFKKDYDAITYGCARTYLLHLKNRFEDIGMMSDEMSRILLENDCSDRELLEYSFEEAYRRQYAEEVER